MSLDELLGQIANDHVDAPQVGCFYSRDGDCLFCHVEDVPYVAERVDELLTVYRADDDGRLVGAQIKGVRCVPKHDALELSLIKREGQVQVINLLLLTYKARPEPALEDSGVFRRKARYMDALSRLHGVTISADQLQLA